MSFYWEMRPQTSSALVEPIVPRSELREVAKHLDRLACAAMVHNDYLLAAKAADRARELRREATR